MTRRFILTLAACVVLVFPLHAKRKAIFLSGKEQTCLSGLPSGQKYQMQRRVFRWSQNDGDVYTDAVAYYALGSGEFFWWGQGYTNVDKEYLNNLKKTGKLDCGAARHDILELQDGEWTDFYAENGSIHVFHSRLRFPSIKEGWQYVAEHPEETAAWLGSGKWLAVISIYKELGDDFFRPEKLRLDARAYNYDSLVSATKVGSTWQLEIKGADEPNRAEVLLDSTFRLVKVTRTVARKE
jgi:hypothetical protein